MAYDHAKVVEALTKALFLAQHEPCHHFETATDYGHGAEYQLDAERMQREAAEAEVVYQGIVAAEKKLQTVEDFLVNQFAFDEDQYTKHELYEMLDHVTRLLDTEDGTLSPEQQAEINEAS